MSTVPRPPDRERAPAPIQRPDGVGDSHDAPDGIPKVTGEFAYSSDL